MLSKARKILQKKGTNENYLSKYLKEEPVCRKNLIWKEVMCLCVKDL